ncbi:hypothetical protein H8A95_31555 [Bradyrhizobium sp. Pear76]|uniref:hypothetical protein n=1 Tax=Bradyrhizobium oropedii TaxID=1571201 RepID=UPI001E2ACA82|nr:hypothetical protein [Bradyrhizobium oropedii]MCC8966739.1 hypothetical protein [Bradyrhizobium oropedii]
MLKQEFAARHFASLRPCRFAQPISEERMYRISRQAAAALIFLGGTIASEPVHARLVCQSVDKISFAKNEDPKGYKKITSTSEDDMVKTCKTTSWSTPLDNWYYGDYDFLYSDWAKRYHTEAGRREPMASRPASYITEIRRYGCTMDGTPLGYFALHLANTGKKPSGELTFLCVLHEQSNDIRRGAGLGFELFNEALSTAGLLGRSDSINLKVTALPTAIPFYSSLDVDCSSETRGKVTVTEFETGRTPYTKDGGARVKRRFFSFNENWGDGKPSYKRIKYGCTSKDDYDKLVKLGAAMEAAGHHNPLTDQKGEGEIDFQVARDEMCHALDHKKELVSQLCGK